MKEIKQNERLEMKGRFSRELENKYSKVSREKEEQAFDLAWEYGHSSGEHEIRNYFIDLMNLLK